MKNFNDIAYKGIDVDTVRSKAAELTKGFRDAGSFEEQDRIFAQMNVLRGDVYTQSTLVSIRHSIDTNDVFYKEEKSRMDEVLPELEESFKAFSKALADSKFRSELKAKWGEQLFALIDVELSTFAPEIVPLLQKENRLTTEYSQLIASAKIEFEGEEYTLAQLAPFEQDPDRSVREAAARARTGFMADHETELDRIYDDLVNVRTEMAQQLGFNNFVELGYARMSRTDYGAEEVAKFREQIKNHVVPLVTKLKEEQQERIDVDKLMYFDESFMFPSGNAKPKGDDRWVLEQGKTMYDELSPETKDFYRMMLDSDLMDVMSRKGKESGGYCTYIPDEKVPFVFANMNGTSGDVDVLTHEIGHAFQSYQSRDLGVLEYLVPTMEAAEIHSMSMEYFAYPWMENFFKEDTAKYKYDHLASTMAALPYLSAVDEFQHIVYSNPEQTAADRKRVWKELEQTYMPHRSYEGNEYLDQGALWQRQLHIFVVPFYYIDYGLAQICALQFWKRMNEDRETAWNDYLNLCKLGGSKSFTGLVESAGLTAPFEEGCVENVIAEVEVYLKNQSID